MKTAPVLFLLVIFAMFSADAASAAWIIELNSGRTLEANSCRVEKGRVYLEYPVGEASFALSRVKTIHQGDVEVSVFQKKGVREVQEEPYSPPGEGQDTLRASEAKHENTDGNAPPAEVHTAPVGEPPAKSPAAAYGQFELKPALTPTNYQQLMSDSVELKTPQEAIGYDPQVEDIVNGLENADEAHRTDLEKQVNSLFETDDQQNK